MKEPIQVLVLEKQVIKFYDETDYEFGSSDNEIRYDKIFISSNKVIFASLVGIELYEDDILKGSCINRGRRRCNCNNRKLYIDKLWRHHSLLLQYGLQVDNS
jgi:hypothetical protein